jgi:hypothetical protein
MAPALVRARRSSRRLVLSGMSRVGRARREPAYRRLGMHRVDVLSRGGWVALVLQASW